MRGEEEEQGDGNGWAVEGDHRGGFNEVVEAALEALVLGVEGSMWVVVGR